MANLSYLWAKRLAIGVAAVTLPLAVMAFGPMGDGPGNCPPMPHIGNPMHLPMPGMFPDAPPPGIMPPFLHHLELSDAQQDKVFNLLHDQAPKARDSFKAASKAMEELRRLSSSDHFDASKARSLAETHAQAMSQIVLMHAELDAKLRSILTPEQRKKLDDAQNRAESACNFKRP